MFGSVHWDEVEGVDVTCVRRLESGQLDKKGVDKTGVWILVELKLTGGIVGVDPGKLKLDVDVTGV